MDPILKTIDFALKQKGLSDSAASIKAVGHASLLKNLRMPRKGEKRYNLPALQRLAGVLDLEFYFGPPRENTPAPVVVLDGQPFSTIPRHDGYVAAGDGHINMDADPVDQLAFTQNWLLRNGIQAGSCFLITVKGDSMTPRINDGDLVLIDKQKKQISNGKVYAFNDAENGARIKRFEVIPGTAITLISDNPEYAKEHRTGDAMNTIADNIIGQVIWSGHNWN